MIKFLLNAINVCKMSNDEYALNRQIDKNARRICIKYLAEYYETTENLPHPFAVRKAINVIKEDYSKADLRKLASIAILQFEQEQKKEVK